MKKITLICGHPNLSISVGNKLILAELQAHFGEKINIRQLDSLYPNAHFDVAAEQASLVEADIIVWQFPMYWYNVPALLKKWIDDVLLHDFAYGSKGDKLQGKKLILSFTTGGGTDEYDGNHAHKSMPSILPLWTLQNSVECAGKNRFIHTAYFTLKASVMQKRYLMCRLSLTITLSG